MDEPDVSLANLAGGIAVARFDHELKGVLENILDPNTPPTAKRSITLTVTFAPQKSRDLLNVEVDCKSKLAAAEKVPTRMFVALTRNGPVVTESNPNQPMLPEVDAGTVASLRAINVGNNA